jgi:hypothetical protein
MMGFSDFYTLHFIERDLVAAAVVEASPRLARISHRLTTQTDRSVLRRAAYSGATDGGKLTLCAAGLKPRAG